MMQAQAPFSPLTPLLPPLIERLLLLITDLASLTAHHLCEVLYVLARLQRSGGLLNRLLQQVEQRLAMGLGLEFATPSPSPNPSPNPSPSPSPNPSAGGAAARHGPAAHHADARGGVG